MKTTIVLAAVIALASSLALAPAQAKHHRHHNKQAGVTTGMSGNGSSGPSQEAGGTDKSRPGSQGVSRTTGGGK